MCCVLVLCARIQRACRVKCCARSRREQHHRVARRDYYTSEDGDDDCDDDDELLYNDIDVDDTLNGSPRHYTPASPKAREAARANIGSVVTLDAESHSDDGYAAEREEKITF